MPYTVGLQSAASALINSGFTIHLAVALAVFIFINLIVYSVQKDGPNAPSTLPGISVTNIIPFFRRRYDFLNWGFCATGQSSFQFHLLRNKVVVVSGESARQAFFSAKGLDLTEGFKILSGALPMVRGVTSDLQVKRIAVIHKRLAAVQKNAPLGELLPTILEDSRRVMETWGASGTLDPFDKVYELVFQTTIRSLTCSEIADDPVLVARLKRLYDTLDTGTTPATVLLPWLPTPAMIKKLLATKEIYEIVLGAVKARESSGVYRNDTLQMLLDNGDEKLVVIGFIMGLLIAGARATGTTASWLTTYLGGHPEWRMKAQAEIESLISSHGSGSSEDALSKRLASIPLEAWESDTPILDSLIRETTRVAQPHTAMRRNVGPEIYIDGKVIATGDYVIYPFSDIHLNADIYPDPWKFDPGREEPKKVPFGYVGWGGGRTICLGTRLAKIELKLITAMLVLGFQICAVDKAGELAKTLPTPNWNDILLCRPEDEAHIKYGRTGISL